MSSQAESKIEGQERLLLAKFLAECSLTPRIGLKALGLDWATVRQAAQKEFEAGRYQKSRRLRELELAIARKRAPYGLQVAHTLNSIGMIEYRCGEYKEAKRLLQQALGLFEAQRSSQKRALASVLTNLGLVYNAQGDHAVAAAMIERSLFMSGGIAGANAENILPLNNLATVYIKQKRYQEAEALLEKIQALTESKHGRSHRHYALYLNNLGFFFSGQNRNVEAQEAFIKSIAIYESALGPNHPMTATPLENWAWMNIRQGRPGAAEPLFRRAIAIREQALGENSPRLLGGFQALADLLRSSERAIEAAVFQRRIQAIKALMAAQERSGG